MCIISISVRYTKLQELLSYKKTETNTVMYMIWEIDHLEKSLVKKFPEELEGF